MISIVFSTAQPNLLYHPRPLLALLPASRPSARLPPLALLARSCCFLLPLRRLQLTEMLYDVRDVLVELHHLLVVAAALQGGTRFHVLAHRHVDPQRLPLLPIRIEKAAELLEEVQIEEILRVRPERMVVVACAFGRAWLPRQICRLPPLSSIFWHVALLVLGCAVLLISLFHDWFWGWVFPQSEVHGFAVYILLKTFCLDIRPEKIQDELINGEWAD